MNDEIDNVLEYVKDFIGVGGDSGFDTEILAIINMITPTLNRLGFGEYEEVISVNKDTLWSEIIDSCDQCAYIKSYVGLKAKRIFENQTSTVINSSIDEVLKELEFNIQLQNHD